MRKFIGFALGVLLPAVSLANPILSNTLTLGNKAASDKKIVFDKGAGAANPQLKWNNGTSKIQFSNDGTNFKDMGSGAGGINLIANGDAEDGSVTGWTTYDDGGAFVDGTGGTSSATFTNTAVTPLRDTKSFLFTSGTGGEGACYTFAVQPSDQARMLRFTGEYSIASGTYPTDDLQLWIYDVTNSAAIQPAPYKLTSIASGVTSNFMAEFQTSATGTSYRACFHQATTATYTVKFDSISVGPTPKILGTPVTDWKSYTPGTSWSTWGTATGQYRQVGDSAQISFRVKLNSAPTGIFTVSIPSGLTIDTAKLPTNFANIALGNAFTVANSQNAAGIILYASSTAVFVQQTAYPSTVFSATNPATYGNNDFIEGTFSVPIVGWSSSTQMSEGAATRVITARAYRGGSTHTTTTPEAPFVFNSGTSTDGSMSTAGVFTAQTPGWYRFAFKLGLYPGNGTTSMRARVYKRSISGALQAYLGEWVMQGAGISSGITNPVTYRSATGTDIALMAVGETLTVNTECVGANCLSDWGSEVANFSVERISGPDQIAASEKVSAKYTTTSSTAVANTGSTIINFDIKKWDSHNAVTTGASWKFTAPKAAKYKICSLIGFTNANWGASDPQALGVFNSGGTVTDYMYYREIVTTISNRQTTISGCASVSLLGGDYVSVRAEQGSANTTVGLGPADESRHWVTIDEVGNY